MGMGGSDGMMTGMGGGVMTGMGGDGGGMMTGMGGGTGMMLPSLRATDRTPDLLPAAWPPGAQSPTMVTDSARGKMVLFPGSVFVMEQQASTTFSVWEWDGTAWTDRTVPGAASWPSPRSMVGAAYDSRRGVVVTFGGVFTQSANPFSDELWEWNGSTFTQRMAAGGPSARNLHAMAYDPARGVTVVFGGQGLNDLWEWDGSAWTNRTPSMLPAAWPSVHEGSTLVWDSDRRRMILFGGHFTADLWEWDGNAWTNLTPSPLPDGWAFKRQSHAAAYDPARHTMLVFGGLINDRRWPTVYGYGRDLLEWSPATQTFQDLTPAQPDVSWPLPTYQPAGAFDTARNRFVIFGGTTNLTADISRELHEFGP
jgi:hypothetical protein